MSGDAPPEWREGLHLRLRVRQAPNVVRRAVRHPGWLLDNLRLTRSRRQEHRRRINLAEFREYLSDERTAVLRALGTSGSDYDAAKASFWAPAPDPAESRAVWDARQSLQSLVSITVRLVKPSTMVETGVARGYTTAITLAAMRENGQGHLYSVDLPALEYEGRAPIGDVVPADLRARWTLELGPSRTTLPKVVAVAGPLDVFLHDSDHTYPTQLHEYRTAWPRLRAGGVLLSDDVQNEAFLDFAQEVGATPYLIGAVEANNAIGLMVKA